MGIFLLFCIYATVAQGATPEEINQAVIEEGESNFNIGIKAGTLGMGIDMSVPMGEWFSLRVNANGLNYQDTYNSKYSYVLDAQRKYKLQTVGLLLDYHLLQLRLTGGVYYNKNQIIDITRPTEDKGVVLNGMIFDASSIGELKSTISFNKVSPYVGVGWGNNVNSDGWHFTLDVGLMYHGDPKIDLEIKSNSSLVQNAIEELDADAVIEKKIQEKDLSDYQFYPVVMMGINYSF